MLSSFRRSRSPWTTTALGVAGWLGCFVESQGASVEAIQPLLVKYCYDCHADGVEKGGVALDTYPDEASLLADKKTWLAVMNNLENQIMPPAGKKQPTIQEREQMIHWIEGQIFECDCSQPDPGRVTARRLNRTEYNNTVRDLLYLPFDAADRFPADDSGYGFDNIGDVLTMSPLLLEKYLDAARLALDEALVLTPPEPPSFPIEKAVLKNGDPVNAPWSMPSQGTIHLTFKVEQGGPYKLVFALAGDQAGPDPIRLRVTLDQAPPIFWDSRGSRSEPEIKDWFVQLTSGEHAVQVEFLNDYYEPKHRDPRMRGDRNFMLNSVRVAGPTDLPPPPKPWTHRQVFPTDPPAGDLKPWARDILKNFARRAFRRPPTAPEIDRLMPLVDLGVKHGETPEGAVALALRAIMVSPHFLFRWELHPSPSSPDLIQPVNEHALANRLSYFLWSSMPDKELMALADRGLLRARLNQQVHRMLRAEKSRSLTTEFAAQWLQFRNLDLATPSPSEFPEFNDLIKEDMRTETEMFFDHIRREDRDLIEFLTADYTFLNERLARHYNLPNVTGFKFRKVSLKGTPRGGVLTHGSILTITSNPSRTSPVKRGLWVLDNLLGTPAPPPPEVVPEFEEGAAAKEKGSLRERLELHRANAICASCHARMDPLGFGLENFDGIGRWRDKDGGFPVDSAGLLVSGESFQGPAELRQILAQHKETEFLRCITERMLTYALGRGMEFPDRCAIDQIVQRLETHGRKFSELVLGIVESVPFQKMRGEGSPES